MITQQNINDARTQNAENQSRYSACKIDVDAFAKYLAEVNGNLWNAQINPVPIKGPFTVKQASLIGVAIPNDYDFPQAFQNPEIWQRASEKYDQLEQECILLESAAEASKKTLTELEKTYAEDLARATEIAANDPAVIAAKSNAAAAAINSQAEIEKKKIEAENQMKMYYMVFGFIFILVIIALIFLARR